MIENSLVIGTRLRGAVEYTIVEPLHQGGFGITYRATAQIMVGNIPQTVTFAIKEFFMASVCSRGVDGMVEVASANRQLFRQARQNFMDEAQMLHALKHEGIVPVNEVFEQNATVYYVMSYLGTMSLYDYVAERGSSLAEDEAKTITRQLASAVAYLHNRHILHLDIKPGNIMMVRHGNAVVPVLIDFGQAVSFADGKPKRSKGVGGYSQGYSPLELKQVVTGFMPSIDVYSLASTLLYMLSGADPCDASVQSKHTVYKALPVGVSQAVQDVVIGGLQRDARVRLKDVSSFLAVLSEGATATSATVQGSTHNPTQAIVVGASSGGFLNRKTISIVVCAAVACGAILLASRHGVQKPAHAPTPTADSDSVASVGRDTANTVRLVVNKDSLKKNVGEDVKKEKNVDEDVKKEKNVEASEATSTSSSDGANGKKKTDVKTEQKPVHKKSDPTHGTIDLGYAVWTGGVLNGKPQGSGRMRFRRSHRVEGCYTPVESGDEIINAYCDKGVLQNGLLYRDGKMIENIVR